MRKGLRVLLVIGCCCVWTVAQGNAQGNAQNNTQHSAQKDAQDSVQCKMDYVFKQQFVPQGMDNYLFAIHYYNGKKVYNLRSTPVVTVDGEIRDLKMNPSGTSMSILYEKKGTTKVAIYDNNQLEIFKDIENASALCYTADAKQLLIATPNKLLFYRARKKYDLLDEMTMPFDATQMAVSKNGYYLAATNGRRLIVWNLERKRVRMEFDIEAAINDFTFSDDNMTFAVLRDDGVLSLYDTRHFACQQRLDAMGYAKSCAFHPEGKYISVVSGDTRITTINLYQEHDRKFIDNTDGGIFDLFYVIDSKNRIAVSYNTTNTISARIMGDLAPNYAKLLADELNDRMSEWTKMLPGETLEEYNLRVNDKTRLAQMKLFEEEIATRLAGDPLAMTHLTLGNYNMEDNILALHLDNDMPTLYLSVPADEVNAFTSPDDLSFRNTKYALTATDDFELIYTDVFNKNNQKTYTYDNRARKPLKYIESTENFVPLELIQQSNMEAMKLEEIKTDIINLAKQENTISDHTNISVNAEVVSAQDADGKNILNYKIDFEYEVEPEFSMQEDFAPGKYQAEESGAAMAMLSIVQKAFEQDFAQYVQAGKKVQVNIKGMADASRIHRRIAYSGCYGDFEGEPIYKNNMLSNISVTKASGITENEQLAFLRAVGCTFFIQDNIPAFNLMNTDYRHYIEVTEGTGGAYRRITIEFIFVDAF